MNQTYTALIRKSKLEYVAVCLEPMKKSLDFLVKGCLSIDLDSKEKNKSMVKNFAFSQMKTLE